MSYKKILRSLVLGLVMALVVGGAAYALTLSSGENLTYTGGVAGATEKIDFDSGGSMIWDDWMMHIATDDHLYLDAPGTVYVENDMDVTGDLVVDGTITGNTVTTGTTATTFTFGSGFDADVQNMIVNLGSIDSAVLTWTGATHILSFSDNFTVDGNLAVGGSTVLTGALTSNGVTTLNGNVTLGNASTDAVTGEGALTMTDLTVLNNGSAVRGIGTLTSAQATEGIGGYFEGHLQSGATYNTVGCCGLAGLGGWLNIDTGANVDVEVWGASFGVWEAAGADMTGSGDVVAANFGLHLEGTGDGVPNANVYMFRFNTTQSGTTPTAWFRAANPESVAATLTAGTYTTADGYIDVVINATTYRMPLYLAVD